MKTDAPEIHQLAETYAEAVVFRMGKESELQDAETELRSASTALSNAKQAEEKAKAALEEATK